MLILRLVESIWTTWRKVLYKFRFIGMSFGVYKNWPGKLSCFHSHKQTVKGLSPAAHVPKLSHHFLEPWPPDLRADRQDPAVCETAPRWGLVSCTQGAAWGRPILCTEFNCTCEVLIFPTGVPFTHPSELQAPYPTPPPFKLSKWLPSDASWLAPQ